jgi:hypothetical protein
MKYRYTPLLVGLLLGITFGLFYGWVIQPAEFRETSPQSLQDEYQADIVLMVAEIFAAEGDIEFARQWMTAIGFESNTDVVAQALNYAQAHDFSDQDIELLNNLSLHIEQPAAQTEAREP